MNHSDDRLTGSQEDADRRHDLMANAVSRPESLNDFLLHQLAEMDIDDRIEQIAERIISTLDARDGGYLRTPLADLLPAGHTPEDLELAETALAVVQSLRARGNRRPQSQRMSVDADQTIVSSLRGNANAD